MKKITSVLCLVFVVIMVMSLPIAASTPYYTYTYSISGTALRSPDAYTPDTEITASTMGIDNVSKLAELYPELSDKDLQAKAEMKNNFVALEVDSAKNVYLVDRDNSRVVVLDPYYQAKFVIESFKNANGNIDTLKSPEGIFITEPKVVNGVEIPSKIYVCDTGNSRILTFDIEGNFITDIGKPQSELIDASAVYMPTAVAVDRYDRLYVVDRNSKGGIVVMTDTGEFTGYIGAQKTSLSLWDRIWRRFQTEEQRRKTESEIVPPFNNITLAGDFVYVTIKIEDESKVTNAIKGKDTSGDFAPVKMLNAAGSELMRRNGFYPPSGEVDFFSAINAQEVTITGPSVIVDVAIGPEKTWSIVDQKRSKVFTYDFDGNLLFAFGDTGDLLGNITKDSLKSIAYQDTAMLLLDGSTKSSFTLSIS